MRYLCSLGLSWLWVGWEAPPAPGGLSWHGFCPGSGTGPQWQRWRTCYTRCSTCSCPLLSLHSPTTGDWHRVWRRRGDENGEGEESKSVKCDERWRWEEQRGEGERKRNRENYASHWPAGALCFSPSFSRALSTHTHAQAKRWLIKYSSVSLGRDCGLALSLLLLQY